VRLEGDGVRTFAARVPIRAGRRIALQLDDGARLGLREEAARGARLERFSPPLGPRQASTTPSTGPEDAELLLGADVEADADADGFGDGSQDRCPGSRGGRAGCP
jgi:hypothetical protein